jgi:hypothetical protein
MLDRRLVESSYPVDVLQRSGVAVFRVTVTIEQDIALSLVDSFRPVNRRPPL